MSKKVKTKEVLGGVGNYLRYKGGVDRADNIASPGIYNITTVGDVFSGYLCFVIDISYYFNIQIAIAYNTNGVKVRQDKGEWYALQVVTPTT